MPTQATARAKVKPTPAAPPTIIEVTDGLPHKDTSYVSIGGTVQFDNHDPQDYRIRLWSTTRDKHPFIDVFLPAVGSVTLMADPLAKKDDECAFDLLPTDLQNPTKAAKASSGGGGKIIIGPGPSPKKASR
jgi:hypothetical protein